MNAPDIGAMIGTAFGSAYLVLAGAKHLFAKASKPAENKIDAVSREIQTPDNVPPISQLVMSTAQAVQRLEDSSQRNGEGITRIIETQRLHGERLAAHDERITRIEDHPSLAGQRPKRTRTR